MTAQITTLIDKFDSFELVRDKVGAILVEETAKQKELALAAGKDPQRWALRIYSERSNPWSEFIGPESADEADEPADDGVDRTTPIVNVWFDQSSIILARSNVVERQTMLGVINVDCHGCGNTSATSEGHDPGDARASLEAQRCARLVRNILMSAAYTYLDLRGTVGRRWVQSIQVFQPPIDGRTVQHVVGARVALHVEFNELSPQVEGQPLELISVGVQRHPDGLLFLTANFPHTEPVP